MHPSTKHAPSRGWKKLVGGENVQGVGKEVIDMARARFDSCSSLLTESTPETPRTQHGFPMPQGKVPTEQHDVRVGSAAPVRDRTVISWLSVPTQMLCVGRSGNCWRMQAATLRQAGRALLGQDSGVGPALRLPCLLARCSSAAGGARR